MKLILNRIAKRDTYTIGKLYIDDVYFCDTIEDKDRGLTSGMALSEIASKKIKHRTAIPTGSYEISMNVVSPKYSSKKWYVSLCGAKMPRLLNVPGFDGILIHPGNTANDTSGCLIVGRNTVVGKVTNSRATFKELYLKLKAANDKGEVIIIQIK